MRFAFHHRARRPIAIVKIPVRESYKNHPNQTTITYVPFPYIMTAVHNHKCDYRHYIQKRTAHRARHGRIVHNTVHSIKIY